MNEAGHAVRYERSDHPHDVRDRLITDAIARLPSDTKFEIRAERGYLNREPSMAWYANDEMQTQALFDPSEIDWKNGWGFFGRYRTPAR